MYTMVQNCNALWYTDETSSVYIYIYIQWMIVMTMSTRASRDRDNFHARVFNKVISLSETRIKSTHISGLPMVLLTKSPKFRGCVFQKFSLKGKLRPKLHASSIFKLRPVNCPKRWEKRARSDVHFWHYFKHLLRLNLLFPFLILVKIQY
jgi:hypothetical protein